MTGCELEYIDKKCRGRDRASDVIGAGALILRIILERAGAGSVVVSEHDILDGIAASIAG